MSVLEKLAILETNRTRLYPFQNHHILYNNKAVQHAEETLKKSIYMFLKNDVWNTISNANALSCIPDVIIDI